MLAKQWLHCGQVLPHKNWWQHGPRMSEFYTDKIIVFCINKCSFAFFESIHFKEFIYELFSVIIVKTVKGINSICNFAILCIKF